MLHGFHQPHPSLKPCWLRAPYAKEPPSPAEMGWWDHAALSTAASLPGWGATVLACPVRGWWGYGEGKGKRGLRASTLRARGLAMPTRRDL